MDKTLKEKAAMALENTNGILAQFAEGLITETEVVNGIVSELAILVEAVEAS